EPRYQSGATSMLDVTQATTLLQSTQATIPCLQASLEQAQNALCTLVGRATDCAPALLEGGKGIPTPPIQVAVGLPADLLRRRPDLRAAELRAMAQSARVGVARADRYPTFSLTGMIGLETSSGAGKS